MSFFLLYSNRNAPSSSSTPREESNSDTFTASSAFLHRTIHARFTPLRSTEVTRVPPAEQMSEVLSSSTSEHLSSGIHTRTRNRTNSASRPNLPAETPEVASQDTATSATAIESAATYAQVPEPQFQYIEVDEAVGTISDVEHNREIPAFFFFRISDLFFGHAPPLTKKQIRDSTVTYSFKTKNRVRTNVDDGEEKDMKEHCVICLEKYINNNVLR